MERISKLLMVSVLIGIIGIVASGCISEEENKPLIVPNETTSVSEKPSENGTNVTLEQSSQTIKCELCHANPQKLSPHLNGGKLCINCHGSQVHNIHIGEGTTNLNCETCHGFPPIIPTISKGEGPGHYVVCENCHAAPPDNLKPSNGDLITVHLSRGKYCTNCHGMDIGKIHEAAISKTVNKTNGQKPHPII